MDAKGAHGYYAHLKMCRKELGCLWWVHVGVPPDLSAYVGTFASLQTRAWTVMVMPLGQQEHPDPDQAYGLHGDIML